MINTKLESNTTKLEILPGIKVRWLVNWGRFNIDEDLGIKSTGNFPDNILATDTTFIFLNIKGIQE